MRLLFILLLAGCAQVEPVKTTPIPHDTHTEKLHHTLDEFFKPRD